MISVLPRWKKFDDKIRRTLGFDTDRVLLRAHSTIKYKLELAFFHITVLNKAYKLRQTGAKSFLKSGMIENVIINLSSALDALAHEINQINMFNINFNKVAIDHCHSDKKRGQCVRCKLDAMDNNLSKYINLELPRRSSNQNEHWYFEFQGYRNQMIHRTISVLMLEPGGDFLPDDPAILDLTSNGDSDVTNNVNRFYANYTQKRELREYSECCLTRIVRICEQTYECLNPLIF